MYQGVGSPKLSDEGGLFGLTNFDELRVKRNVEGEVAGKLGRNELHYAFAQLSQSRNRSQRQTQFAPWLSEGIRWACPYGHFEAYPSNIPQIVEDSLVACRDSNPILAGDLQAWSGIIARATHIPNIYA